jgi:hypothetical protein
MPERSLNELLLGGVNLLGVQSFPVRQDECCFSATIRKRNVNRNVTGMMQSGKSTGKGMIP